MKLAHKSTSKKITGVEVIRNCYNLSQTQIGNITGYSQRQVSRVETHKSTMPAPMRKLLDILVVYNATLKKSADESNSGARMQYYESLLMRLHDILTSTYASTKNEKKE